MGHARRRTEKDFRRLLDDKSIDAIAVATPDHWHALMAVMGCQAGKEAYSDEALYSPSPGPANLAETT